MKSERHSIYSVLCTIYILITGGINLYGYFNLPKEIATQFSLTGGAVNRMPTPIYLIIVFILVLLMSIFCLTKGQEQKLKYLLVNAIIVIANVVMIVSQL